MGTILERHGESFSVDINGPSPATLPVLAFESATVGVWLSLLKLWSDAGGLAAAATALLCMPLCSCWKMRSLPDLLPVPILQEGLHVSIPCMQQPTHWFI